MKQIKMFSLNKPTLLYRHLLIIMATTVIFFLHTTWAHEPARVNFLFIQSVKKCLHHGGNPNIFTTTRNLSGFSQTPPRDCKSVFRHFLMNFRSYVWTVSPDHSNIIHSNAHTIYSPLDLVQIFYDIGLNHNDVRQFRMTNMWAIVNDMMKSGVQKNKAICTKNAKPVVRFNNQNEVHSDNGIWETLIKKTPPVTPKAHLVPTYVEKVIRRRRDVEHDVPGSVLEHIVPGRSAGRESRATSPQRRAYGGAWYDLIRNRRQQVLSVNNAMATLSDMLMQHHRNRVVKNRERLRYYMMLAG